ncbi:hypothetical protein M8J76_006552 [Diaphorina citri]|nr:hypothetical protein M8J76_006552 [Diaphorina citri]
MKKLRVHFVRLIPPPLVLLFTEEDAKRRNITKGLYEGPYFEENMATTVIGQMGGNAFLPCIVCQINGKSVSWIRKRDAHILTVDSYTFVADLRFQTYQIDIAEQFTLQVKYLQPRDSGRYECQVSTEPKMSHVVDLRVVVPNVTIVPSPDMIVKRGSIINITCTMTPSLQKPDFIFWYHNGTRVIDYNKPEGPRIHQIAVNETLISSLTIFNANLNHTGNYSCHPSNINYTMTFIHVINDATASMSMNKVSPLPPPFSFWTSLSLVTCLGVFYCSEEPAVAFMLALFAEQIVNHLVVPLRELLY